MLSRSQDFEIFFLLAVPTEHLEGHRQPHFPTSPNSVGPNHVSKKIFSENVTIELITFSILHIHLQTYEYMALGFSKLDISFVIYI